MSGNEGTGTATGHFSGVPVERPQETFPAVASKDRDAELRRMSERELLATMLPKVCDATGCDDWFPVKRTMERRDCRILFLASKSGSRKSIALKMFRGGAVSRNLAMNLHRRSAKLHAESTAECTVPEPVACFHEENAWAMHYVNAPIAGSLLMRGCFSPSTRRKVIRQAGTWLRWFHGSFGETRMGFEAAHYLESLEKSGEKLGLAHHRGHDRFLGECVSEAKRIAADLNGRMMRHSTAHGDFTPFNLFVDRESAVGFDFRANQRLPIHHDMSRFLIYLDVYRLTPAPEGELSRCGCRMSDFEGFMDAYGGDRSAVEDGTWLRLHFLELTRRLVSVSLPKPGIGNRLARLPESAALRRCARAMLKGMD